MKKRIACIALSLAVCLLPLSVLAEVYATPNQKLFFRTGPNTEYVGLCEMPESTSLIALEYESGNGVTWVLVEYTRDGRRERAYTGLKRMTVHGEIPWADHLNIDVEVTGLCNVYGGPGYDYSVRGSLSSGNTVTLLRIDGDFAFVDYYDYSAGAYTRGWVASDKIENGWWSGSGSSSYGYPSQPSDPYSVSYYGGTLVYVSDYSGALLYEQPNANSGYLTFIPYGAVLESYCTTNNGFLYVGYNGWEGYVLKNELQLY